MTSAIQRSGLIKQEADKILHDQGIYQILSKYGEVTITGSYELDLMLKKDIDISLVNSELSNLDFFQLSHEISEQLQTHSIYHRNTRIKPISNRPPDSLYWGFQFKDWNIDLWLVPFQYCQDSKKYTDSIKSNLTEERRKTILDIKEQAIKDGCYGKRFTSKELYKAVLSSGVSDYNEFMETFNRS